MLHLVWSSCLHHDRSWKVKMRVEMTEEEHIKQGDGARNVGENRKRKEI